MKKFWIAWILMSVQNAQSTDDSSSSTDEQSRIAQMPSISPPIIAVFESEDQSSKSEDTHVNIDPPAQKQAEKEKLENEEAVKEQTEKKSVSFKDFILKGGYQLVLFNLFLFGGFAWIIYMLSTDGLTSIVPSNYTTGLNGTTGVWGGSPPSVTSTPNIGETP